MNLLSLHYWGGNIVKIFDIDCLKSTRGGFIPDSCGTKESNSEKIGCHPQAQIRDESDLTEFLVKSW